MSIVPRKKALKGKESGKLWNTIVDYGVESLNEEDRNTGTAGYSSTKKLLWESVEAYSGLMWSTRNVELDVWRGWIVALLSLGRVKEKDVWISISAGSFPIKGMDCLHLCGHNAFQDVAPGRYVGIL